MEYSTQRRCQLCPPSSTETALATQNLQQLFGPVLCSSPAAALSHPLARRAPSASLLTRLSKGCRSKRPWARSCVGLQAIEFHPGGEPGWAQAQLLLCRHSCSSSPPASALDHCSATLLSSVAPLSTLLQSWSLAAEQLLRPVPTASGAASMPLSLDESRCSL